MEKNNNTDKGLEDIRDRFEMEPPKNAWRLLDAELEKKQAMFYRQRGNRFKWLSIGLALLLVSVVTYYSVTSVRQTNFVAALNNSHGSSVNNTKKEVNNKPLTINNAEVKNISSDGALIPIGGFRTQSSGHSSNVPGSLSTHKEHHALVNETIVPDRTKNIKSSVFEKQSVTVKNQNIKSGNIGNVSKGNAALVHDNPGNNSDESDTFLSSMTAISVNHIAGDEQWPEYSLVKKSTANDLPLSDGRINKSHWSIAAFYSPNNTRNHLQDNPRGQGEDLTEYKKEKPGFSYAIGLLIGYDLTEHLVLSTGCIYSTMAYEKTFSTIYVKYGSDDQLHYQYPTSCGNIEVPNTHPRILHKGDSINVNANCAQSFQIINIPLVLKYQVTKNRITCYGNGGFSLNYVLQEKAIVTIGSSQYTIINNIDGLKKMNYGFLFGLGVQYNFYNHVGIFMEPCYRGSITSITHNTDVNAYPHSFGLNTGLSIHF